MATSKSGAKRSLFKKPAWASTTTITTDDDTPIFGQAHHYQEILQGERERRERHAAKQRARAEKEAQQQIEQERETKKRRISKDADDSEYGSDSDSKSVRSDSPSSQQSRRSDEPVQDGKVKKLYNPSPSTKVRLVDQLNTSNSPRTRSQRRQPASSKSAIILDDSDNSPAPTDPSKLSDSNNLEAEKNAQQQNSEPESDEEEDEYLRELNAKARQEARSKRLGIGTGRSNTPGSPTKLPLNDVRSPSRPTNTSQPDRSVSDNRSSTPPATGPNPDDAEVQIWIRTIIPNTKDMIVNRKIHQPLDKVKEFWIKHNNLDSVIAAKVFFTWNNTRLYNSTTMRGIIDRLKKTHPTPDGSDPSAGKIIIEAVTDEIFEYRQKQRARQQAEKDGIPIAMDAGATASPPDQATNSQFVDNNINHDAATGEGEEGETTPPPQPKPGIIIKLRAQGHDELAMRVRPNSTMRKILLAFCKLRGVNVAAHTQTWLSYDGDKLGDDATVDDVGFEDDDAVEVYLR